MSIELSSKNLDLLTDFEQAPLSTNKPLRLWRNPPDGIHEHYQVLLAESPILVWHNPYSNGGGFTTFLYPTSAEEQNVYYSFGVLKYADNEPVTTNEWLYRIHPNLLSKLIAVYQENQSEALVILHNPDYFFS